MMLLMFLSKVQAHDQLFRLLVFQHHQHVQLIQKALFLFSEYHPKLHLLSQESYERNAHNLV